LHSFLLLISSSLSVCLCLSSDEWLWANEDYAALMSAIREIHRSLASCLVVLVLEQLDRTLPSLWLPVLFCRSSFNLPSAFLLLPILVFFLFLLCFFSFCFLLSSTCFSYASSFLLFFPLSLLPPFSSQL
jgi:hypothetical protein